MKILLGLTTAITALTLATMAPAATYKWVDDQGNVHYSQYPPPDKQYERLNIKTPRPSPSSDPAPTGAAQPTTGTTGSGTSTKLVEDELAKNKALREQNCKSAKKNLEIYTVYKRFKDKDGNIVRMDDAERQQKIDESKRNIEEFCD